MAKITQNVTIDYELYQWLKEEQMGRRQKSLSITLCEILRNYQIMIKSVDRARQQAEKRELAQREAEEMIAKYRRQIINDKKEDMQR